MTNGAAIEGVFIIVVSIVSFLFLCLMAKCLILWFLENRKIEVLEEVKPLIDQKIQKLNEKKEKEIEEAEDRGYRRAERDFTGERGY